MEALLCPQCNAPITYSTSRCDFCGVYLVLANSMKRVHYTEHHVALIDEKEYAHAINFFGTEIHLLTDEQPILSGFANHYLSKHDSRGGKLLLTNQRIIFQSHTLNFEGRQLFIEHLASFDDVRIVKNFFFSQIIAFEGAISPQFVVYNGKKWLAVIQPLLKDARL